MSARDDRVAAYRQESRPRLLDLFCGAGGARRLAQLLGGEDQRRKLTHEDRESVRRIALLLAREDHVDVTHAPDERLQQRLLNRRQILDLMRQLAHACELFNAPRTEVLR